MGNCSCGDRSACIVVFVQFFLQGNVLIRVIFDCSVFYKCGTLYAHADLLCCSFKLFVVHHPLPWSLQLFVCTPYLQCALSLTGI